MELKLDLVSNKTDKSQVFFYVDGTIGSLPDVVSRLEAKLERNMKNRN